MHMQTLLTCMHTLLLDVPQSAAYCRMTLLAPNLLWTSPMSCLMHMCKLGSVLVDCIQGVCLLVTVSSFYSVLCCRAVGAARRGSCTTSSFSIAPQSWSPTLPTGSTLMPALIAHAPVSFLHMLYFFCFLPSCIPPFSPQDATALC